MTKNSNYLNPSAEEVTTIHERAKPCLDALNHSMIWPCLRVGCENDPAVINAFEFLESQFHLVKVGLDERNNTLENAKRICQWINCGLDSRIPMLVWGHYIVYNKMDNARELDSDAVRMENTAAYMVRYVFEKYGESTTTLLQNALARWNNQVFLNTLHHKNIEVYGEKRFIQLTSMEDPSWILPVVMELSVNRNIHPEVHRAMITLLDRELSSNHPVWKYEQTIQSYVAALNFHKNTPFKAWFEKINPELFSMYTTALELELTHTVIEQWRSRNTKSYTPLDLDILHN